MTVHLLYTPVPPRHQISIQQSTFGCGGTGPLDHGWADYTFCNYVMLLHQYGPNISKERFQHLDDSVAQTIQSVQRGVPAEAYCERRFVLETKQRLGIEFS